MRRKNISLIKITFTILVCSTYFFTCGVCSDENSAINVFTSTNAMCQINYYVSAVTGPKILFLLKKCMSI